MAKCLSHEYLIRPDNARYVLLSVGLFIKYSAGYHTLLSLEVLGPFSHFKNDNL